MNKRYFRYIGFLLLAWLGTACQKTLEVSPQSSIPDQVFWQSEDDFAPYLNGIYATFRAHMNDLSFGEDRSESFVQGVNARFSPYWSQVINPGNSRDWTAYYGTIGHINLLLDKIEGFRFTNENNKNRVKAEALAVRAAMYFYLAKIWGDVPLVLAPVYDEKAPQQSRKPVAEVFAQVNADIEQALSLFPENGYVNKYRFSKPAVYALKADVTMWTAKVLGGGIPDLNQAIAAISEVEKSGVSLVPNFRDITTRRNPETILSLFFDRGETGSTMYALNSLPLGNYSGGADNAASLPIATNPGNAQAAYAVSPAVKAWFAAYPNDKRIPATYIPELQKGTETINWPNKFRGTQYADDRVPDDDIIVYRLADLYLLKAEAYAASGQLANAVEYLNKVRQRAGIGDYTGAMDRISLEREILNERGRELFHENKRWWDLVRFHKGGTINVYEVVPNLKGKNTPLYWPVATRVLSLNASINQTEGY